MLRLVSKRLVIKLGTGILSAPSGRLDLPQMQQLVAQIARLKRQGYEIILVTSGAIGGGMGILDLEKRPTKMQELQACAAIGQPQLMRIYDELFRKHSLHVAQLLLTYFDLDSRSLFRNSHATIEYLLKLKTFIPIINENDVVSYEEIKFGDNDRLSAEVAVMVHAKRLIILSNVEGLKSQPDGSGVLIPRVKKINAKIESLAGVTRSQTSVGGMISKIKAAQLAMEHGITLQIADGRKKEVLLRICRGEKIGTLFKR